MTYPHRNEFFSTIIIPKGYRVDFIPENYSFKNELFEIQYNVTSELDKLNVTCIYSFNKAVYAASDYENIKFWMTQIVNKANEKVVFSKI